MVCVHKRNASLSTFFYIHKKYGLIGKTDNNHFWGLYKEDLT